MDNNRRNPFANHPNLQNTFMNVLRHLGVNPRHNNNGDSTRAHQQPQVDDMDDLPPLEPIHVPTTTQGAEHDGNGPADAQISASNPSGDSVQDVDMPPAISPAFASFVQPTRQNDEGSMPDLQSVSDSSDESNDSVDEVEMMPDLQPVDDDNDSTWTSDEEDVDDDLPPLEPIAGSRRARVDDDEDDDRDRRHPSQRTGNAIPNHQRGNAPPFFAGINPPRAIAPPAMFELFQTFMGGAGPPNTGAPQGANTNPGANRANQNPGAGHRQPPPIHFTVDMSDGVPRRVDNDQDGNGGFEIPPDVADIFFPDMTAEERASPLAQFQALIERLGGAMGQVFGFPFEEEKEDPERAKKLLAGLEVVPVGLVKRMERVGGAPGGHVDDSTGEVDVPGCAICWDTLLNSEGDGFKTKETEDESSHSEEAVAEQVPATDNASADVNMEEQPSTSSQHSSDSSSDPPTPVLATDPPTPTIDASSAALPIPTETQAEEDPHKIVCLPCAHVFHASCLLPWFSRPRQTTCPTCRFNIDPESLTYVPRPRQARPGGPPPGFVPPPGPGVNFAGPVPGAPTAAAPAAPTDGDVPAGGVPATGPDAVPNATPQGVRGVPAGFAAMFGNANNGPFQFVPIPVPIPGGTPGPDFAAMFDGAFRAQMAGQQGNPPGATGQGPPPQQQQQQWQQQQMPQFFTGPAMPPPRPNSAPGNVGGDHEGNAMFTVDFTLFTNSPFEGNGVRRQTHVFANQIFGGEGAAEGNPPPAAHHPPPFPPPPFMFDGPPAPGAPSSRPRPSPREKKQWTPPPAPGPTLRSRVEQREREVGLRCCDASCGVGPSDEDPVPDVSGSSMKQLSIRPLPNSLAMGTSVCPHTFHPACLVSAERVAGWGGEDKKENLVEVSCPNCRAVGCVSREEWEEGVSALA